MSVIAHSESMSFSQFVNRKLPRVAAVWRSRECSFLFSSRACSRNLFCFLTCASSSICSCIRSWSLCTSVICFDAPVNPAFKEFGRSIFGRPKILAQEVKCSGFVCNAKGIQNTFVLALEVSLDRLMMCKHVNHTFGA